MFREIIKDIEDMDGDRKNGGQTLPIVFGKTKAKWVGIFFGNGLLWILGYWLFLKKENGFDLGFSYILVGIIIPLLFSLVKLFLAKTKKEFHLLSQVSKYIMLSGILYLLILSL